MNSTNDNIFDERKTPTLIFEGNYKLKVKE